MKLKFRSISFGFMHNQGPTIPDLRARRARATSGVVPCLCAVLLALGNGCVATTTDGKTGASYVGDRAHVLFDEIVVSLGLQESNSSYQNLHITPAALVNMTKRTSGGAYEAEGIVRRLEPRVAVRLTEVLNGLPSQSLKDTASLRRKILAEAQAVVDEAVRQWEHGEEYRLEMVIAGLYWTDASVGRAQPQRRGWW